MQSTSQSKPVLSPVGLDDNPSLALKQGRPRKMERADLHGRHEYVTRNRHRIQIWKRDGKFLARARWQVNQIGVTLGSNEADAEHELRRVMTEMDDGTFVPRREARRQRFSTTPVPRHDLRSLVNAFLTERKRHKGRKTAQSYGNRLMHAMAFAELPKSKKTWPVASSINRQFAIEFRTFLFAREVTRNGKDGGLRKRMSPKMVQLCLEVLRTVLKWAARGDVRQLPSEFVNPITDEIIGSKFTKDPLRRNPVPMDDRIRMVQEMDAWQLYNLIPTLILPIRFEDLAGAKISDFDLNQGCWRIGTRLHGNDFNKGRMNVQMPLPPEVCAILRAARGHRSDGPMFRSRVDWERNRPRRLQFSSPEQFEELCETAIRNASKDDIGTEQDRKVLIRRVFKKCGAISTEAVGREIRQLLNVAGISREIRPYDLRAAVTTDMHDAGIRLLELRYLTEHSVKDILNVYTSLNTTGEMAKYFQNIAPLLAAIDNRARELGIAISKNSELEEQSRGE